MTDSRIIIFIGPGGWDFSPLWHTTCAVPWWRKLVSVGIRTIRDLAAYPVPKWQHPRVSKLYFLIWCETKQKLISIISIGDHVNPNPFVNSWIVCAFLTCVPHVILKLFCLIVNYLSPTSNCVDPFQTIFIIIHQTKLFWSLTNLSLWSCVWLVYGEECFAHLNMVHFSKPITYPTVSNFMVEILHQSVEVGWPNFLLD